MRREHKCRHCGELYMWDDEAPPSQHHDGIGCEVNTLRSKLDTCFNHAKFGLSKAHENDHINVVASFKAILELMK